MALADFPLNRKEIQRIASVVGVLTKYGFEDFVSHSRLKHLIPSHYIKTHDKVREALSMSRYARIRLVLEELGPTYVKFGQLMSNREDMLPPELVGELEKLQDKVPPVPQFDIREVLQQEFEERNPDEIFRSVEKEPEAAASLAQVHEAVLADGTEVVLKVQRPGIEEKIRVDIRVMQKLARLLEQNMEEARSLQLCRLVEHFELQIMRELRFTKEVSNIERFAKNFEGNERIYVPGVYRELSSDTLLCMERVEGVKISNIEALDEMGIDRKSLAIEGIDSYIEQILDHGFFHADPHPGNVFVLGNGSICFLDYGMMGSILPNDREILSEFLFHLLQQDPEQAVNSLEDLAVEADIPDRKNLEYELYELVELTSHSPLKDVRISDLLNQFKIILRENHIVLPFFAYHVIRALIIMEGVGKRLYPELNIMEQLEPYARKLMYRRLQPDYLIKHTLRPLLSTIKLAGQLPEDIRVIMSKLKSGKHKIDFEFAGQDEFQNVLTEVSNRLVMAVIVAALSIGSSILVGADMPPHIFGVPLLGALGFLISGLIGIWIVISILRSRRF